MQKIQCHWRLEKSSLTWVMKLAWQGITRYICCWTISVDDIFSFLYISLHNIYQPWLHDLTLWIWFGKMLSYVTWFSDLDVPWFHTTIALRQCLWMRKAAWSRIWSPYLHTVGVAHLMLSPGARTPLPHVLDSSQEVGGLAALSHVRLLQHSYIFHTYIIYYLYIVYYNIIIKYYYIIYCII